MSAAVLVVDNEMTEEERRALAAACEMVGRPLEPLSSFTAPPPASFVALVAGLVAPGERRIPKLVLELLRACYPRIPLLLMTRDPLARPTIWLESGHLCLVSASASPELLASRIRMLMPGAEAGSISSPLRTSERRTPRVWAAACGERLGSGPFPSVFVHAASWTGVLPADRRSLEPGLLKTIEQSPASEHSQVIESCGQSVAYVRLATTRNEWVLHCPSGTVATFLASPNRAPMVHRLRFAAAAGVATLRAASGDVLTVTDLADAPSDADSDWQQAARNGGGAVVQYWERRALQAQRAVLGIVAEVL